MNKLLDKDFLGLEKLNEYLKTNYIILSSDSKFRITSLSFAKKEEMTDYINNVKTKLISDPNVRTEKELIKAWKEKGIDIEDITKKFQALERKYWNKMTDLGKLVNTNGRKDLVEELEKEIETIRNKQKELNLKKTDLLVTSYEMQYLSKMYRYASYLALESKVVEKDKEPYWVKSYGTFDDFVNNIKEDVANEALTLIALVDSHDRFNA